jgi:MFS family permease
MREIHEIFPDEKQTHETYDKVPVMDGIITTVKGGRAFWMPALAYFFVFGTMMLFQGRWVVKYFDSVYEFAIAGTVLLSLLAIGKMISTALASTVAKKVGSKRKVILSANIGYLAVWGIIWMFAGEINMLFFWAGINFMFGFFSGFMSLGFAQAKEWFAAAISGTTIALFNTMVFLGGGILQTISIFVIDEKAATLSQFSTMWGIAFFCVVVACVMSFFSKDNNTGEVKKIIRKGIA